MGHLLSTVNKEAAEAIQPAPSRPAIPDVGHIVVYTMRAGHGRQGMTRFNGLVRKSSDRGELSLLVLIDAGDFVDEDFVLPAGPGQETHCWEWPDDSRNADGFRGTIAALHERAGHLEAQVKELRAIVLGDFDRPKISIIDIMQDFENRLRNLAIGGKSKPKK